MIRLLFISKFETRGEPDQNGFYLLARSKESLLLVYSVACSELIAINRVET